MTSLEARICANNSSPLSPPGAPKDPAQQRAQKKEEHQILDLSPSTSCAPLSGDLEEQQGASSAEARFVSDDSDVSVVPAIALGWSTLCCLLGSTRTGVRKKFSSGAMPQHADRQGLLRQGQSPRDEKDDSGYGVTDEFTGSGDSFDSSSSSHDRRCKRSCSGGGLLAMTSALSLGTREPGFRHRLDGSSSTETIPCYSSRPHSWRRGLRGVSQAQGTQHQAQSTCSSDNCACTCCPKCHGHDATAPAVEPLPPHVMAALKSATGFNLRRIHDWHSAFQSDCPEGEMRAEDFVHLFRFFHPDGSADGWARHLFRSFDYEQLNKLDFKRFLYMMSVIRRGTLAQHICWAFDLYDVDHVGLITKPGLTDVLECVQKVAGYEVGGCGAEELATTFLLQSNKHGFEVVDLQQFMEAVMEDDFMLKIALDLV